MGTQSRGTVALGTLALGALLGCARVASDSGAPPARPPPAEDGPDQIDIPAGAFWLGCNDALDDRCDPDELPGRTVTLSAYAIDRTEVSEDAWVTCMDAGACGLPDAARSDQLGGDAPVTGVTRAQSEDYCAWRGGRLPTEAEWEKAARGTDGRTWPWGETEPSCALAWSRSCGALAPVASLPAGASPYGLLHVAGNAWEWVGDGYDAVGYQDGATTDPVGATEGAPEQIRGVDLWASEAGLRVPNRSVAITGTASPLVGLRCARDVP